MSIKNRKPCIIVLLVIVVILIGIVAFIFLTHKPKNSANIGKKEQATMSKDSIESAANSYSNNSPTDNVQPSGKSKIEDVYSNWNTYKNPTFNYTIRYPQGWSKIEKSQSVFVTIAPIVKPDAIITIVGTRAETPPSEVLDLGRRTIFYSNNVPINGYETYDVKFGDNTYVNHCYVISHEGTVVEVCMNEMAKKPPIDNSKYVDQFDLIVKSLEF